MSHKLKSAVALRELSEPSSPPGRLVSFPRAFAVAYRLAEYALGAMTSGALAAEKPTQTRGGASLAICVSATGPGGARTRLRNGKRLSRTGRGGSGNH